MAVRIPSIIWPMLSDAAFEKGHAFFECRHENLLQYSVVWHPRRRSLGGKN